MHPTCITVGLNETELQSQHLMASNCFERMTTLRLQLMIVFTIDERIPVVKNALYNFILNPVP